MELSKNDTKLLKGVGISLMLLLHLFARKEIEGLYYSPSLNGNPLVYYVGLIGDACRPVYLFATGYAFYVMFSSNKKNFIFRNFSRLLKLLVNFWIVFLIFVPLGFYLGKDTTFTSSFSEFILNLFLLSNSYNGAWWFLKIYIILVLISPLIIALIKSENSKVIFLVSGSIYFLSYIQRFRPLFEFHDNSILATIVETVALLGTSQFSFVVGIIFAKELLYSKIHSKVSKVRYKNIYGCLIVLTLFIIHGFIESAIIGPINGITIAIVFTLMNKSKVVESIIGFLGKHSTNIWLTHMFFYMTIFPNLTFAPKIPILIYVWLFTLCIGSSYVINLIYKPITQLIDTKRKVDKSLPQVESKVQGLG
ncbi:acyltransferase family protein [Bacillus sp. mrc49]|uniref:acyltransferase family protein n=1 Tax=Bacillus sp. mrc49 TaxID=2054913 RepID=UPI000C280783|nr:acyltransferase [Bacillus sp. mrc49]PJN90997.1 acyltransferase [Bacillus sp. mrc49]